MPGLYIIMEEPRLHVTLEYVPTGASNKTGKFQIKISEQQVKIQLMTFRIWAR